MPNTMKTLLGTFIIAALLGSPAYAFKETPIDNAPAQAEQKSLNSESAAVKKPATLPDGVALSESNEHSATLEKSFQFRIPGLGEKGVLPKLNFGLELLYSAQDADPAIEDQPADDVTIKGTLRHKF